MNSTDDVHGAPIWVRPTLEFVSRAKLVVLSFLFLLGGIGIWVALVRSDEFSGFMASGGVRALLVGVVTVIALSSAYCGIFAILPRKRKRFEFYLNGIGLRSGDSFLFVKYIDLVHFDVHVIGEEVADDGVFDAVIGYLLRGLVAVYLGPEAIRDAWSPTPKEAEYSVLVLGRLGGATHKLLFNRGEHEILAPIFAQARKQSL